MTRHVTIAVLLAATGLATAQQPTTAAASSSAAQPAAAPSARRIEIKVTEAGFEPREFKVKRGQTTTLAFTRVTDRTCITAIDIPSEEVKGFELPLKRTVTLTITPRKTGVEAFHCSAMGMGHGKIVVVE